MEILKVSSKSNPNSVAGALANVFREKGTVEVQAVGAGALNQAIKAVKEKEKYGKSIFTKEDVTQMIDKLTLRQNQSDEVKSLHVLEVENLIKEEIKVTE